MPDLTWDEDRELRAAFERDKWAGEWNSLPIAVERIVAARVAQAKAEAWDEGYLRGATDEAQDIEPADNPYREDPIK